MCDAGTRAAGPWATGSLHLMAWPGGALCPTACPARTLHLWTRAARRGSTWALAAWSMAAVSLSARTAPVTGRLPAAAAPRLRPVFAPPVLAQRIGPLPVPSE
jgi:hypothetical protein